jgi:hypothetical protein
LTASIDRRYFCHPAPPSKANAAVIRYRPLLPLPLSSAAVATNRHHGLLPPSQPSFAFVCCHCHVASIKGSYSAKDFVVRKARTIALCKARGTQQSTLIMSLEIPWGFHTQAVLRNLAGLMSRKKVSV